MHNEFHFPYRTQSGEVDVYVSWPPGAVDYEDLEVSIYREGREIADLCESTRARIKAEGFLHAIRRGAICK